MQAFFSGRIRIGISARSGSRLTKRRSRCPTLSPQKSRECWFGTSTSRLQDDIPWQVAAAKWDMLAPAWKGIDPCIVPYLRRCDVWPEDEKDRKRLLDTGFHVIFLGTGSGGASNRMPSCTFVRNGGEGFLFDAGEGSQKQIKSATGAKLNRISRIFISHLHADHSSGLLGVLLSSNIANLADEGKTLQIYGPPGLYNYITTSLVLTLSKLRTKIEVNELVGGQARLHWKRRGSTNTTSLFRHENVFRKTIECGDDGVWTIKEFDDIPKDVSRRSTQAVRIRAAEVLHVPNVQTFGYVLEEQQPTPRLDPMRAVKLGVSPGRKYNELKNGYSVLSDDGTREIKPEEVLLENPHRGRKFAFIADSCFVPEPMANLCMNADVLVHEATLSEEDRSLCRVRGHATASMAGQFADTTNAGLLVLNHFSGHVSIEETQERAKDALQVIKGKTRVLGAYDFLEIAVPREGFHNTVRDERSLDAEKKTNVDNLRHPREFLLPREEDPTDDEVDQQMSRRCCSLGRKML